MSVPADMLPAMKIDLADIDPDVLEDIIGTDCYDAALGYVRRHAVGRQVWVGAHNALFGIVLGSHGDYYTPAIYFSPGPPLEVLRVHCGCAARHGCEHARRVRPRPAVTIASWKRHCRRWNSPAAPAGCTQTGRRSSTVISG
jgi:hypothetical protein